MPGYGGRTPPEESRVPYARPPVPSSRDRGGDHLDDPDRRDHRPRRRRPGGRGHGGGGIHGFVFLAYAATAILVALNQRWHLGVGVLAVVSAVIPYATIPTEIWLHRTRRLDGVWRLDATDDPRDGRWYDRLMRWFLRRPWMLALLLAVGIVALYVILLLIGPPGGK